MDKKEVGRDVARALGLLSQLGISMGTCIAIGVFGGMWLDKKLGTSPWLLLVLSFVGAAASFKIFYEMTIKEWKK